MSLSDLMVNNNSERYFLNNFVENSNENMKNGDKISIHSLNFGVGIKIFGIL